MKGLRFQKRKRILPGLWLNFSKSGVTVSIGIPGLMLNLGRRGVWFTAGLPGTGLSYRKKLTGKQATGKKESVDG